MIATPFLNIISFTVSLQRRKVHSQLFSRIILLKKEGVAMAKEFGDVLKEIRVDRGYSQQYVAEGIMGQSAYSKIERNEIEPTFRKWLAILEKLNVSVDEFRYILNKEDLTAKEKLINEFLSLNANHLDDLKLLKDAINEYLKVEEDYLLRNFYYACESLIILHATQNIEEAQFFAKKVWDRMDKFDKWYLLDIRLINYILFIFPIDVAVNIGKRVIQQLAPYHKLKEAEVLLINIDINLALLLIDDKKYLEALSYLEKVIPLCKKSQKYNQLAIAYARKGIILTKTGRTEEGSEYIKKACAILHAIEDTKLLSELEKELSHYLNMESENPLQLDMLLQEQVSRFRKSKKQLYCVLINTTIQLKWLVVFFCGLVSGEQTVW
eukprot:TRINITY_DN2435_c0_g1_i2.p1 TRINITY_DN2435_c0_g1~~TRINITY_DN2435_c0_g1_i2.p1  ORF type:complete len:381 (-),score=35.76 TRINITY_DN2435_c0_g1_i2:411-1553(-)